MFVKLYIVFFATVLKDLAKYHGDKSGVILQWEYIKVVYNYPARSRCINSHGATVNQYLICTGSAPVDKTCANHLVFFHFFTIYLTHRIHQYNNA